MICSTGSSSSSGRALGLLALLACAAGCAGPRAAAAPSPPLRLSRVALFPADNLSGGPVPLRGLDAQLERMLVAAGLKVVKGDEVERFLEHHRLRFTGGIDEASAAAAREELGVDAVLLTAVEGYASQPVPRLAATLRLVSAGPEARILWMDGVARAGDDSPGLLGLGLVRDYRALEARELARLGRSLSGALAGVGRPAPPCELERRFRPRASFRSPRFDPSAGYSVAVLPFLNQTSRRRAGEVFALELTRQLAAVRRLQVVEPGVTRDRLIRYRVIMEGGVSLDTARVMLDTLQADLVVAGYARELVDGATPSLEFTAMALDRSGTVVWQATSHATGSDGVWFFDAGKVSTATSLACQLARGAVVTFLGEDDLALPLGTRSQAREARQ
ncbi:MAG TPA: hypothetical protein VFE30_11895 [Anaeromyxobacteraceae bacterium]|jgi:TolB-like protein|nr:hypothetical protein [Anaeromyxobacteraceae bacterium]